LANNNLRSEPNYQDGFGMQAVGKAAGAGREISPAKKGVTL